jgi:hypothetical protein
VTEGPAGDVYVCGTTWGDLSGKNTGMMDGFTGQFSTIGKLIRLNQFGTDRFEVAEILKVDTDTSIYIGGSTSGNFGSQQAG